VTRNGESTFGFVHDVAAEPQDIVDKNRTAPKYEKRKEFRLLLMPRAVAASQIAK
jgi:hypothetical protein